ncbi:BTAD domain-containing putative transcriptional regulator [Kitasatospora sp. NPDC094028]
MLQVVFRILGALDVQANGTPVPVAGARQRTILSMLLLFANRVVSVDALADAVWHGNPPNTFVNQIAICVSGLRKTFKAAVGADDLIVTMHPGYMLFVGEHRIDAVEFEECTARAREAARVGDTAGAVGLLDTALGMWRGAALEGVAGERVEAGAARLAELRLDAYEELTALRLELGQHRELVGELSAFIRENGLREQARAQLMLAQYRCGRRAEALETFREGRRLLIEELGIEPGPALRELHEAVLADSPRLVPPAEPAPAPPPTAGPAQLPSDVAAFTGRADELSFLDRLLDARDGHDAVPVGLVTGIGGVGKTALAVHCAHRVAARFPDGQLFADLRGFHQSDQPAAPGAVLERFLLALGVPAERIPADLADRGALFRSVLGGRRVLVVLDNARSVAQVRPLLPGSGRCGVLITSRSPMGGLAGDYDFVHLPLDALHPDEAVTLLDRVVGDGRIVAEPAEAARLADLCDRLPLALRIAAARIAARPHWRVRTLVARLEDRQRRLDELGPDECGVRAVFRLSYRDLPERAARMYRLLGLLNVPDFAAWAGAALLDIGVLEAEDLIEELVDAQLLDVLPGPVAGRVRYRFKGLLRLFAHECAEERVGEAERRAGLRRAFGGWLFLAREAHRRVHGGDHPDADGPDHRHHLPEQLVADLLADPAGWFEAERAAIVGAVEQAARSGEAALAWDLAMTGASLDRERERPLERRLYGERVPAAALRTGDELAQTPAPHALGPLGTLEIVQWRYHEEETERLDVALRLFEHCGRALVRHNLALHPRPYDVPSARGGRRLALDGAGPASDRLEATRSVPGRFLVARAGLAMACVTALSGDRVAAAGCLTEAERLFEEVGASFWSAKARRLDELLRGAETVSAEALWRLLES